MIRRVDGRSPGRFIAEEIAGLLGADLHIRLSPNDQGRCCEMAMDPPPPDSDMSAMFAQLTPPVIAAPTNPPMAAPFAADVANTAAWRAAEIPAANGHGTARGLATVYAVLAGRGEHNGVRLLSPEVERIREGQGRDVDLLLGVGMAGVPMEFALGVVLSGPECSTDPILGPSGTTATAARSAWPIRRSGRRLGHEQDGCCPAGDPRKVAILEAVYASLG